MQGQNFKENVLTLPLDNYDLVLGVQWLVELGDIIWNFKELHMKFQAEGKEYKLQGDRRPGYSWTTISSGKLGRVLTKTSQVAMVQCFNLYVQCWNAKSEGNDIQLKTTRVHHFLQLLLDSFEDVFLELKGLPPIREHDHKIFLKKGSQAINCRPYKYRAV